MEIVSHIAFFLCAIVAIWSVQASATLLNIPEESGYYKTIDGLRGYLGVVVFFHHACTWYFYLRSGKWDFTPISMYTTLGQASIVFIFMVTGFLFFGKILNEKNGNSINWGRFMLRRLMRLSPMYAVLVFLLSFVVLYQSNFKLNENLFELFKNISNWLFFTMFSSPKINDFSDTSLVVAGMTWTLPYEWAYYLMLPAFAMLYGRKTKIIYMVFPIISVVYIIFMKLYWQIGMSFLMGMLSVYWVKMNGAKRISESWLGTSIIFGLVFILVYFFNTSYGFFQIIILSIVFFLIAGGNTIFGILVSSGGRRIGQIAYSFYLMHGLFLYIIFALILGVDGAANFTPIVHWGVVLLMTPILIFSSAVTYKYIEKPPMKMLENYFKLHG